MKEASDEDPILPTVFQSLHSLSDSASHVQILKPKWSLLAAKAATLLDRLSDVSIATRNPLSSDLLRSISTTCSAAASLAVVCGTPNPPGGKLKTQSEVDSLSAKLDAHINDLQVLFRSGVLTEASSENNDATAVPSPAIVCSNRRESVRAEVRNLITRLQIGSNESKSSVLDLLLGLLQEDDKNVVIAVAQGIVPILVNLLDSTSSYEIKEKTVTAIAKISTVDSSKHVLSGEGLILLNNLLRVLESGSIFAKEKSCITLKVLSNSKENARAIVSRGGISSLLEICQQGTPNSQALAAGVLRNLSAFEETKESMIEEHAVSTLLGLCNSGTVLAQENSFGCLCNLISRSDDLKLVVAREGGVNSLINFWDSSPPVQILEVVVQMVGVLSSCPNIAEFLVANAFLNRIIGVLNCGFLSVRIAAAKALCNLAYSTKTKKELGETGCIRLLINMLDGKAIEEREAASKALLVLITYMGNRKILRKEEKGIASVVQLLDPLLQNLNKEYPLSILGSIVHSKKCRKQMVAAGVCGHLQKLAEANVEGTKKLLKSLDGGGLWGVFGKR